MNVSDGARTVLSSLQYEGNLVKISHELDRKTYTEVDKVLKRLDGKWNPKHGAHVFPENSIPAADRIRLFLETGELPKINEAAFFPTPENLVSDMLGYVSGFHRYLGQEDSLSLQEGKPLKVLEPSAGHGAIATALRDLLPKAEIHTVEWLPSNQKVLHDKGFEPFCGDFMDYEETGFDLIVSNPPFSLPSDKTAYLSHMTKAFDMLNDNGTLIAILPLSWMNNSGAKEQSFRDLVGSYTYEVYEIEAGAFKNSGTGTMIPTCILFLEKSAWKQNQYSGWDNFYLWEFFMQVSQIERLSTKYDWLIENKTLSNDSVKFFVTDVIETCRRELGVFIPSTRRAEFEDRIEWEWNDAHGTNQPKGVVLPFSKPMPVLTKENQCALAF